MNHWTDFCVPRKSHGTSPMIVLSHPIPWDNPMGFTVGCPIPWASLRKQLNRKLKFIYFRNCWIDVFCELQQLFRRRRVSASYMVSETYFFASFWNFHMWRKNSIICKTKVTMKSLVSAIFKLSSCIKELKGSSEVMKNIIFLIYGKIPKDGILKFSILRSWFSII